MLVIDESILTTYNLSTCIKFGCQPKTEGKWELVAYYKDYEKTLCRGSKANVKFYYELILDAWEKGLASVRVNMWE